MLPVAPSTETTRLSTYGVTGCPVSPAEYLFWSRAVSVPSLIQSVRVRGRPLSKTLSMALLEEALTKGAAWRPG